jgi:hypothetical protein
VTSISQSPSKCSHHYIDLNIHPIWTFSSLLMDTWCEQSHYLTFHGYVIWKCLHFVGYETLTGCFARSLKSANLLDPICPEIEYSFYLVTLQNEYKFMELLSCPDSALIDIQRLLTLKIKRMILIGR